MPTDCVPQDSHPALFIGLVLLFPMCTTAAPLSSRPRPLRSTPLPPGLPCVPKPRLHIHNQQSRLSPRLIAALTALSPDSPPPIHTTGRCTHTDTPTVVAPKSEESMPIKEALFCDLLAQTSIRLIRASPAFDRTTMTLSLTNKALAQPHIWMHHGTGGGVSPPVQDRQTTGSLISKIHFSPRRNSQSSTLGTYRYSRDTVESDRQMTCQNSLMNTPYLSRSLHYAQKVWRPFCECATVK